MYCTLPSPRIMSSTRKWLEFIIRVGILYVAVISMVKHGPGPLSKCMHGSRIKLNNFRKKDFTLLNPGSSCPKSLL